MRKFLQARRFRLLVIVLATAALVGWSDGWFGIAQEAQEPPAAAAPADPGQPAGEAPPASDPPAQPAAAEDAPPTDPPAEDAAPAAEDAAPADPPAEDAPPATPPADDPPAEDASPDADQEPAAPAKGPAPAEDAAADAALPTVPPAELPPGTQPPADVLPGAAPVEPTRMPWYLIGLFVVAVLVVPFWIGNMLANRWRMPDYGWKIGLALCTILAAAVITYFGWPPHLGPDLSGGVNLIYEVSSEEREVEMDKLIAALSRRINPAGVKEVTIRQYGERQVEIIIPRADDAELRVIKERISTAGALEFRITANERDHQEEILLAEETLARDVMRDDEIVARWVKMDLLQFDLLADRGERGQAELIAEALREEGTDVSIGERVVAHWFTIDVSRIPPAKRASLVTRTGEDGQQQVLVLRSGFQLRQSPRGEVEVLVIRDPYDVTGAYLDSALSGYDTGGRPAVNFTLKGAGSTRFAQLTTDNRPDPGTGFKRLLGIILDDTLLSAPQLNEPITGGRGQVTGRFTQEEVDFLISILNAGSLPAALDKTPISEQATSPTLGWDTIVMGATAMAVSMGAVLLFILFYYRFAGIIACGALLANLLLLLAVMILIKGAFTLPGIAGLVLTVGMAVDANVLIFERIREELGRGAALRMAIRNGFSRATRTIVDANVTTLITAIVLYWIGTDQIKGFAVVLILGIVMSMYTAIFCSRIVFDIAEKRRWITALNMRQLIGQTNIDWLSKRFLAGGLSAALILIGLAGMFGRGTKMLDIDFTGGSSITLAFNEPMNIADIRARVAELPDVAVYGLGEGQRGEGQLQYRVDTSIREFEEVQRTLREIFGDQLRTNRMTYEPPRVVGSLLQPAGVGALAASSPQAPPGPRADLPGDHELALAIPGALAVLQEQEEAGEPPAGAPEPPGATAPPPPAPVQPGETEQAPDVEAAPPQDEPRDEGPRQRVRLATTLNFAEAIKHDTLEDLIDEAFERTGVPRVAFLLNHPDWERGSDRPLQQWHLELPGLQPDQAETVLGYLQEDINDMVVFPSSSNIGGRVAGDTRTLAGYALFVSLLMIVGYIWLRFERVAFGLAAVAALVHDVLITIGLVALSAYLVQFVPPLASLLLIEEFKISLPIVAALLTIMGYSLNDTIVIFDRIREVRGKSPDLTDGMINTSINQTLSRTLLTSLTTLMVVAILYVAGGPGIHGFAFALVVGVIAGTYSTIFIASPVLLWLNRSSGKPSSAIRTPVEAKA